MQHRTKNGRVLVVMACSICGKRPERKNFSRSSVPDVSALQVWRDRTDHRPCARCGSTDGVEDHHVAPKYLFGYEEAELWPKIPLCRYHHRLWHRVIRDQVYRRQHPGPSPEYDGKVMVTLEVWLPVR